jgi:hypothetical protein
MHTVLPLHPLLKLLFIGGLAALCVAVHAAGLMVMSRWLRQGIQRTHHRFWTETWLLIRVSWGLIFLHIVEIAIWGGFYHWKGILPDLNTALYFSSITYTTVGYGDVVLSPAWRNFSSAEALVGILMAGLSTSYFFMFLSRLFYRQFSTGPTDRA